MHFRLTDNQNGRRTTPPCIRISHFALVITLAACGLAPHYMPLGCVVFVVRCRFMARHAAVDVMVFGTQSLLLATREGASEAGVVRGALGARANGY